MGTVLPADIIVRIRNRPYCGLSENPRTIVAVKQFELTAIFHSVETEEFWLEERRCTIEGNGTELYQWYMENHDKVSDFWIRINRAAADCPGVVRYIDAVEVALCFGWIDSTQKKIDDGKPIQHFTPRRKRSKWCERNLIRCRRLVQLGEMTPAGLAAAPDLDPSRFVFEDWVLDAIKAD